MQAITRRAPALVEPANEFAKLRTTAHTMDDFHRLAAFCQGQAETYQWRLREFERELGSIRPGSPRYQDLSEAIHISRELADHWNNLAEMYQHNACESRL